MKEITEASASVGLLLATAVESNVDQSWLDYLENMSKQGTWADNAIIQGVADSLKLKITFVESDSNSADFNIIEATNSEQQCVTVHIGHVDEVHYVSIKKTSKK